MDFSSFIPWYFAIAVLSVVPAFAELVIAERRDTLPTRPLLRFFRQWIVTALLFTATFFMREAYLRGMLF